MSNQGIKYKSMGILEGLDAGNRDEGTWAKAATGAKAIMTKVSVQEEAKMHPKQARTLQVREGHDGHKHETGCLL